jgi:chromosomal replication initiator protein
MYERILESAARVFDVSLDELRGRGRAQHISQARQAAAYALHTWSPLSLAEVGKQLGGRDHSTILHAVAAAERRAVGDADYALRLAALRGGM